MLHHEVQGRQSQNLDNHNDNISMAKEGIEGTVQLHIDKTHNKNDNDDNVPYLIVPQQSKQQAPYCVSTPDAPTAIVTRRTILFTTRTKGKRRKEDNDHLVRNFKVIIPIMAMLTMLLLCAVVKTTTIYVTHYRSGPKATPTLLLKYGIKESGHSFSVEFLFGGQFTNRTTIPSSKNTTRTNTTTLDKFYYNTSHNLNIPSFTQVNSSNKDNNDSIRKNQKQQQQQQQQQQQRQHPYPYHNRSLKYRNWYYYPTHVIPSHPKNIPGFDNIIMVDVPNVYQIDTGTNDDSNRNDNSRYTNNTRWIMSFVGYDGIGYQSFVAQSYDLVHWTNITLAMGYNDNNTNRRTTTKQTNRKNHDFDHGGVVLGGYLYTDYNIQHSRVLQKRHGKYWCLYGAYSKRGGYEIDPGYQGLASSTDGLRWERAYDEPILSIYDTNVGTWENASIYQPFLLELPLSKETTNHSTNNSPSSNNHRESYFMNIYNAKTLVPQWTEQIGIATSPTLEPQQSQPPDNRSSTDQYKWTRYRHNPVQHVRPSSSPSSNTDGFSFDSRFASGPKVFRDHNENHINDVNVDNKKEWWVNFYFGVDDNFKANIMIAYSNDLYHWDADPIPLYKAGGHPSGLDQDHAHKVSIIWNPQNQIWYMFYCAVGTHGRGIGLLTSKPIL